jgi:hypothetical protein
MVRCQRLQDTSTARSRAIAWFRATRACGERAVRRRATSAARSIEFGATAGGDAPPSRARPARWYQRPMSGPLVDLYVLCPEASVALAHRFLDAWAADRRPASDDDQRLRALPAAPVAMYWRVERAERDARAPEAEHVMLFFTDDGAMIAGLSVAGWDRPRAELEPLLVRLAGTVGARHGYVTAEEPPVSDGRDAFIAECRRRELALIDGAIAGA